MDISIRGPKGLGGSGIQLIWMDAQTSQIGSAAWFDENTLSGFDDYEAWYYVAGVTPPSGAVFYAAVAVSDGRVWASESLSAASAGAYPATVTVVDIGNAPLDNVAVWISTDAAGAAVVAGPVYTDAFGEASFTLDAGSYYVWKQRAGTNFANPDTLTVTP